MDAKCVHSQHENKSVEDEMELHDEEQGQRNGSSTNLALCDVEHVKGLSSREERFSNSPIHKDHPDSLSSHEDNRSISPYQKKSSDSIFSYKESPSNVSFDGEHADSISFHEENRTGSSSHLEYRAGVLPDKDMSNFPSGEEHENISPYQKNSSDSILSHKDSSSNVSFDDSISSHEETRNSSPSQLEYQADIPPDKDVFNFPSGEKHESVACTNNVWELLSDQYVLPGKEKRFVCNECSKSFSKRRDLLRHVRIHTGEKPFVCNVCNKCFCQPGNLLNHVRTHQGDRPFLCNVCNQTFARKSHVITHMRSHSGEKPYCCVECKKSFSQQSNMLNHMRSHQGHKPHLCNVCNQTFARKSHLVTHMRSHTGEKPFPCTECEKSFTQKDHMLRHLRIHTGEKPFVCTECSKSFKQKDHLVKHMRSIHAAQKPVISNDTSRIVLINTDTEFETIFSSLPIEVPMQFRTDPVQEMGSSNYIT